MPGATVTARVLEFAHNVGVARLVGRLAPYLDRAWFPALAALVAFGATASLWVPVVPLLVSMVVLRRDRWLSLAMWAVLGSAMAGTLFAYLAAVYAMPLVDSQLPQLTQGRHWHYFTEWVGRYGVLALTVVAASPLAQTPALLLVGMLGMPWPAVALSLTMGKAAKYCAVAALASRTSAHVESVTDSVSGLRVMRAQRVAPARSQADEP